MFFDPQNSHKFKISKNEIHKKIKIDEDLKQNLHE
jgi:hypothetical protein